MALDFDASVLFHKDSQRYVCLVTRGKSGVYSKVQFFNFSKYSVLVILLNTSALRYLISLHSSRNRLNRMSVLFLI